MEACPICRASLSGASTCRRCRADLQRVQQVERYGQRLVGRAMVSLAEGDVGEAKLWLRAARAVHATPIVRALEQLLARHTVSVSHLSTPHSANQAADVGGLPGDPVGEYDDIQASFETYQAPTL